MSEYSSKLRLCNGKSLAAANGKLLPLGCLSARGVILISSIARISLNTTAIASTTGLPGLALQYWMNSCSASFALLTLRRCLRTRPFYQPLGEQLRVFLPGARKLSAGQRLNVDISFVICAGAQIGLSARRLYCRQAEYCCEDQRSV